ncbi:MAG: hypothetical protein QM706_07085 [Nitrospira sp.]
MAEEQADQQRKAEPPPAMSRDEFLAWRVVRLGETNPTRLDNPLWHWLVRTRWSAYQANEIFKGPSPFDSGPMWCFDRFGKSETPLPDGRVVHIGGEHEDSYDPDFFIYNDVTVIAPDGAITLLGYPHEVFAPTDFHSATLVGDSIFVIGGLGYKHLRIEGATPVFRLEPGFNGDGVHPDHRRRTGLDSRALGRTLRGWPLDRRARRRGLARPGPQRAGERRQLVAGPGDKAVDAPDPSGLVPVDTAAH